MTRKLIPGLKDLPMPRKLLIVLPLVGGKIYVIGNNQVVVFDPSKNKWELKAECGLSSYGTALAMYQNRIWSFTKQGSGKL